MHPPEDQNWISVGRAKRRMWTLGSSKSGAEPPSPCKSRAPFIIVRASRVVESWASHMHGQMDSWADPLPCTSYAVSSFSTGTIIGYLEKGRWNPGAQAPNTQNRKKFLLGACSWWYYWSPIPTPYCTLGLCWAAKLFEPLQVQTSAVRTWQVQSVSVVHRCVWDSVQTWLVLPVLYYLNN